LTTLYLCNTIQPTAGSFLARHMLHFYSGVYTLSEGAIVLKSAPVASIMDENLIAMGVDRAIWEMSDEYTDETTIHGNRSSDDVRWFRGVPIDRSTEVGHT